MKRIRFSIAAVVATAVTVIGSATAFGFHLGSGAPVAPQFAAVSNQGASVQILKNADQQSLVELGAAHGGRVSSSALTGAVERLATREGRSIYRIASATGSDCYAVGPANPPDYLFGWTQCSPNFPSTALPILDFTVFHDTTIWRSEGVAADGIARVELRDASANPLADVPVLNNTFHFKGIPAGSIADIAAIDSNGTVVFTHGFRH